MRKIIIKGADGRRVGEIKGLWKGAEEEKGGRRRCGAAAQKETTESVQKISTRIKLK